MDGPGLDLFLSGNFSDNITSKLDCFYDIYNPACGYYKPFELTPGRIVSSLGIALLIFVALSGNILVCTAFFYYRRLRTVTNYFIISLAVSDIMVGALSMPLWLSYELTEWEELPLWIDYHSLVRFWECIDVLSAISSISNLAAISIDRFFSIMTPLRHRTRMTPAVALCMLFGAWFYSLIIALCSIIPSMIKEWIIYYPIFSACLGFFVPLIIITISYISIYVKVKTKCAFNGTVERDWCLARTLLVVICLFVICWMPFFLLSLLYTHCMDCKFEGDYFPYIVSFVKWMHYFNSCCNPFVYGFFNVNFKQAFKALFSKCFALKPLDVEFTDFQSVEVEDSGSSVFRGINLLKRKLSFRRSSQGNTIPQAENVTCTTSTTSANGMSTRPINQHGDIQLSSDNIQGSIENRRSGSSDDTQGNTSEMKPLLISSGSVEQKRPEDLTFHDMKPAGSQESTNNSNSEEDCKTTNNEEDILSDGLPNYEKALQMCAEVSNNNNNNASCHKIDIAEEVQKDDSKELDSSRENLDEMGLLTSKESCV